MMACNGKLPLALIICNLYAKKRGKAADFAREFDKSTQQEIALYTDKKKKGRYKKRKSGGLHELVRGHHRKLSLSGIDYM